MSGNLLDDLKVEVQNRRAVFVVGAGMSVGATGNAECASWKGLLRHGIARCQSLIPNLPKNWAERVESEVDSGDLDDMLAAAEKISSKLGAPTGGEWRRWLRDSVGALTITDKGALEALDGLGVPLATTNYDGLLTIVTGHPPVTWKEGAKVERVLRGDDEGILHLHGHWEQCESVVLGIRSYQQVLGDAHAQTVLHGLSLFHTLVFVGFGAGLRDPNFGALLDWTAKIFRESEYRRFRLALEGEIDALQAEHAPEQRLFVLPYGPDHSDLGPFLRSLGSATRSPARSDRVEPMHPGVAHIPAASRCFGRKSETSRVVDALLGSPPVPVPVLGGPGIGKSTVTLAALHDDQVSKRFGKRRFFVRCETAQSRPELVAAIAQSLGVQPAPDVEPLLLSLLGRERTVLVLDNLETPWEKDTLAVEEFLGLLSGCRDLALVVSIRGEERPLGVCWHDGVRLPPLQITAAREAFIAVAGSHFEDDPRLNGLCEAVQGVPLALTLLAYAAEGEPNLEGLWQRWENERTAMLQRAGGADRISNVEISYELSIQGPRMTDSARRFLSLAALVPGGVAHASASEIFAEGAIAASVLRKTGLAFDEAGRIRMLAPLREYVLLRYPPQDADFDRARRYFILMALHDAQKVGAEGGAEAVARLSPEAANIDAMLVTALEKGSSIEAIDSAISWAEFVRFTGMGSERPLESAIRAAKSLEDTQRLANCIQSLGDIALRRSDHDAARQRYEAALPLYQKVGSVLGEANCIKSLGDIALRRSDHDAARQRYEAALPLYQKVGDVLGEANCIQSLGDIALERSDHDAARQRYEAALPLYQKVGSVLGEANCIQSLGDIALERSDHDAARQRFTEALVLYQRISEPYSIGWTHRRLARLTTEGRERRRHARLAREAWDKIGRRDLVEDIDREFGEKDS
jgi:tetratricopeptide (TPR) repeat protein